MERLLRRRWTRGDQVGLLVTVGLALGGCLVTAEDSPEHQLRSVGEPECPTFERLGSVEGAPPIDEAPAPDVLRLRLRREPASLLTLVDPDPIARRIVEHDVYESLIRGLDENGVIEPELAVSIDFDERQRRYVVHLDPSARWHDGRAVTAADVVYTFGRLVDPDSLTAFGERFFDVDKVLAVDDQTVEFYLDRPRDDFLAFLCEIPILPKHIFDRTSPAHHPAARAPIGSGPFRFRRWVPGRFIELERVEDWRGAISVPARLVYRFIADDRVALDLFRRNDLDIVADLSSTTREAPAGGRLVVFDRPQADVLFFNARRTVFSRASVRRAVARMCNRGVITRSLLGCRAALIESPFLRDEEDGASFVEPLRVDPELARALLDGEGWRDGDGDGLRERGGVPLSFELLLADDNRDLARSAEMVAVDLRTVGVEARLFTVTRGTYLARLSSGRFDAALVSVPGWPQVDPGMYFHSVGVGGNRNYSGLDDDDLDSLIERLAAVATDPQRLDLKRSIAARLRELAPAVFLFRSMSTAVVRSNLSRLRIRDGWFEERWIRQREATP